MEPKDTVKPFTFDPNYKPAEKTTRNPPIPNGSDVTVLMTEIIDKDTFNSGRAAICEGVIAEVHSGPAIKGQKVKVLYVTLDDPRRVIKNKQGGVMNYALQELADFCAKANAGPLKGAELNEFVKNIRGAAVRVVVHDGEPAKDGKVYPKTTFLEVAKQDILAQRKTLEEMGF